VPCPFLLDGDPVGAGSRHRHPGAVRLRRRESHVDDERPPAICERAFTPRNLKTPSAKHRALTLAACEQLPPDADRNCMRVLGAVRGTGSSPRDRPVRPGPQQNFPTNRAGLQGTDGGEPARSPQPAPPADHADTRGPGVTGGGRWRRADGDKAPGRVAVGSQRSSGDRPHRAVRRRRSRERDGLPAGQVFVGSAADVGRRRHGPVQHVAGGHRGSAGRRPRGCRSRSDDPLLPRSCCGGGLGGPLTARPANANTSTVSEVMSLTIVLAGLSDGDRAVKSIRKSRKMSTGISTFEDVVQIANLSPKSMTRVLTSLQLEILSGCSAFIEEDIRSSTRAFRESFYNFGITDGTGPDLKLTKFGAEVVHFRAENR